MSRNRSHRPGGGGAAQTLTAPRRAGGLATPVLVAVLLAGLGTGCAKVYKRPQLGDLYNYSARHHDPERNPVIVIPGLLGSRLVDEPTGTIVWGAFGDGAIHPSDPRGARLAALPMAEGAPLATLRDDVVADGVLDRLRVSLLGLPMELKAYFYMLGVLGAAGLRDENLGLAGVDYGEDHFTCFQFGYDFRRDIVESAQRLHEFILEKRTYVEHELARRHGPLDKPVKFDLVAHSMGAEVVRYYLRFGAADLPEDGSLPEVTWAGAEYVEQAILVAPPNAGSLEAFIRLVEGQRLGVVGPYYAPAILGTYPGGYQLLPRSRHQPVVLTGNPGEPVGDLFDPELWQRMSWGLADPDQAEVLAELLPEVSDPEERRRIALDHQAKCLRRAAQTTAALDQPARAPEGLALHLVAGDAIPTDLQLAVEPESGKLSVQRQGPGDGTVLRSSALLDERATPGRRTATLQTPIDWDHVLFLPEGHLGITRSPAFSDNVLFWLLESP